MLVNLTKKEITILSEFIEHWNDVEQEYQDEIDQRFSKSKRAGDKNSQ